jgi:hypothetical protein
MKLSAIIKSSICVLGLVGASNFLAARANADQAAARASVSITNPSSFTQSVSGEVLLPSGLYFSGTGTPAGADPVNDPAVPGMTLIVTPGVDVSTNTSTNPGTTTAKITSLSFNAGTVAAVSTVAGAGTLSDVVAAMLQGTNDDGVNAESIDDAAAIIKAAAGVDGLE